MVALPRSTPCEFNGAVWNGFVAESTLLCCVTWSQSSVLGFRPRPPQVPPEGATLPQAVCSTDAEAPDCKCWPPTTPLAGALRMSLVARMGVCGARRPGGMAAPEPPVTSTGMEPVRQRCWGLATGCGDSDARRGGALACCGPLGWGTVADPAAPGFSCASI